MNSILTDSRFCSYQKFIRCFNDVEHKKNKLFNFKLFIIMDVEDCTDEQKKKFINKDLFLHHWLYDYIIPIYNDPKLEETMKQAHISVEKKKDYILIFPTNHGDLDIEIAKSFLNKLEKCKCTNMNEYINYCISLVDPS